MLKKTIEIHSAVDIKSYHSIILTHSGRNTDFSFILLALYFAQIFHY